LDKYSGLPDIHAEKPSIRLGIDWVGIKGYKVNLRIRDWGDQDYLLTIDAKADLPDNLRGIHMSRFIDAIRETRDKPYNTLQDFLWVLSSRLLELHDYSKTVYVKASTTMLYRDIYVEIIWGLKCGRNNMSSEYLKISFYGITLCPCLQKVYSYIEGTELRHSPSHMQRARITVKISDSRINIDPRRLVDVLIPAFSAIPRGRLKRIEEYELMRKALDNPRFVEDAVRYAVKQLINEFGKELSNNAYLYVKIVSLESIHPYDTVAIIQGRLGVLKNQLSMSDKNLK
jgi:GTP cyclohydrolase FolE2